MFKNPGTKIILVVDDSEQSLKLIKLMLVRVGFHVITAHSAKEGLALLDDIKPDLIITDQMMPEMDGTQFCREIRKRPSTHLTPILLRTHRMMDSAFVETALAAGADEVLHLLIVPTEFVARVRKLLNENLN
ncbi:MAG: response regulator [Anaerolineae bacterium]